MIPSPAPSSRGWRTLAGVLLKDTLRYEYALRARGDEAWLHLCNRIETLRDAPSGPGVECQWTGTSVLHAPTVWPAWGRRLMWRALARHPVRLLDRPAVSRSSDPDVSFVVVHRGHARLPLLLATLGSIAAQVGVSCECVVAEDADAVEIRGDLPDWVRHVHHRTSVTGDPFNRAAAFNAGVAVARGRVLVLHDNDLLAPADYAAEAVRLVEAGNEVVNHKRFIFYLSETAALEIASLGIGTVPPSTPLGVLQNATGGGSIAVTREAFDAIGGMDEGFVGWGGEDVEFWGRACTRRVWNYGFLPLVHLGHAPQSGKTSDKKTPAMARLWEVSALSPERRILLLRQNKPAQGTGIP